MKDAWGGDFSFGGRAEAELRDEFEVGEVGDEMKWNGYVLTRMVNSLR